MKRAVTAILWFFASWSVAAITAFGIGIPSGIVPFVALLVAAFVYLDPAQLLWHSARPEPRSFPAAASTESAR